MVVVFKTNVQKKSDGKQILAWLIKSFPQFYSNFDFSDCDKVLRIEGKNISAKKIALLLQQKGFTCELLS